VHAANLSGMWEIQGNVIRDLAALNRVETLPWDAWGLIPRHYDTLGPDDLTLLDRAAHLSAAAGPLSEVQALYDSDARLHAPDPMPVNASAT
jgi:hypothetical protein